MVKMKLRSHHDEYMERLGEDLKNYKKCGCVSCYNMLKRSYNIADRKIIRMLYAPLLKEASSEIVKGNKTHRLV